MKTIMLWLQIRALEATAQGQADVLHLVTGDQRERVKWAHMNTLAEITRLKAEYRRIWGAGVRAWA